MKADFLRESSSLFSSVVRVRSDVDGNQYEDKYVSWLEQKFEIYINRKNWNEKGSPSRRCMSVIIPELKRAFKKRGDDRAAYMEKLDLESFN